MKQNNEWLITILNQPGALRLYSDSPKDEAAIEAALEKGNLGVSKTNGEYYITIQRAFGRTFIFATSILWPNGKYWSYATGIVEPSEGPQS